MPSICAQMQRIFHGRRKSLVLRSSAQDLYVTQLYTIRTKRRIKPHAPNYQQPPSFKNENLEYVLSSAPDIYQIENKRRIHLHWTWSIKENIHKLGSEEWPPKWTMKSPWLGIHFSPQVLILSPLPSLITTKINGPLSPKSVIRFERSPSKWQQ